MIELVEISLLISQRRDGSENDDINSDGDGTEPSNKKGVKSVSLTLAFSILIDKFKGAIAQLFQVC